nr:MAG TPA: hypothetical protein [Caudoviricetes sp.]
MKAWKFNHAFLFCLKSLNSSTKWKIWSLYYYHEGIKKGVSLVWEN